MPRRRSGALRRPVAVAAALIAFLAGAGPVSAAPSLDDLYQQLGVDRVSAEYVVVVDTSASMKVGDLYGAVRGSLREFFAALAPEDHVSLIAMADAATPIWDGPVGRSPGEIVSRLPVAPDGAFTDLGAGIDAAVTALEKRTSTSVAGVVLLTDGQHDPAPGSAFPLTEGFAWQALTARAAKLPQKVSPFAVQLRGTNGGALLGRVFPGAQVLDSSAVDQLTTRLGAPKAAVRAQKARDLLAPDLAAAVTVEWPRTAFDHGTTRVPVRLRSTAPHLPLELTELRLETPSGVVHAPGAVAIPPGGTVTVTFDVRWDAGGRSWRPVHRVERDVPLTLRATVGTPWAETLRRDLRLEPAVALANASAVGRGSAARGSGVLWAVALVALLALAVAGRRLWWLRLHPVPGGSLVASTAGATGSTGSVPLRRRRTPISAAKLGISGSGTVDGRRNGPRSARFLEISYSPDGSADRSRTRTCAPDGSVDFDDVRFEWRP